MTAVGKGRALLEYLPDYTVFDLETTGISVWSDEIVEISAAKVRGGKVTDTFSLLVNPGRPISAGASAVNGITDDMVADAPPLSEAFPQFMDFAGEDVLVGHNIQAFDLYFLDRASRALFGKPVSSDYVDTLPLARRCLPGLAHYRLTDLAAYFHISTQGAHRALADCMMNQKCYEALGKLPVRQTPLCPACGRSLVLRKGKFGTFWGCSGFPGCRYTRNEGGKS